MEVQGTTGDAKEYKWTTDQTVNLGQGTVTILLLLFLNVSTLYWEGFLEQAPGNILFSGDSIRL